MTFRMLHRPYPLVLVVCCLLMPMRVAAADVDAGREAYRQACARCHGIEGQGDGWDAKRFYPRPRDLTSGIYKFRSTASGTSPTDDDLLRVFEQGLHGTNMPDWQYLDDDVQRDIVAYVKTLSPIFQDLPPEPIEVTPDPGPAHMDLPKGRAVYEQLGCAACHGALGRGNGPSAAALMDDWGMPIRPANLTQGWNYRGGQDPRSVVLRVFSGIDGAGMPSYTGAVSPDDAWQLAYYVASLQEAPRWNRVARAAQVTGGLPTSIDDARWDAAEQTTVRMRNVVRPDGTWAEPPLVSAVSVQILYNEEALAWRLSWDDPDDNAQEPVDRAAIVLKSEAAQGDVVTLQAWPYDGAPTLDFCAWAADRSEGYEVLAAAFEAVRQPPAPVVSRVSAARYEDGRWHLVIQRPANPSAPTGAPSIHLDSLLSMAVVVWDGSLPDARAVSTWLDVVLHAEQVHQSE